MTWTKLAPAPKRPARPLASASVTVKRDGVPRLLVILVESLWAEFGHAAIADVYAGSGDEADCLRVMFHDAGAFELTKFVKGSGRLEVQAWAELPDRPCANTPCRVFRAPAAKGDDGPALIVRLPLAEWRRAQTPVPSRREASPAPAAAEGPPKCGNGQPIDAIEYLSRKGVKCSRLAEGRFALDGETVTIGAIVKAVNDQRAKAGLDPLARSQIA